MESVLAANPRAPRNLVAASMVLGARSGVAVYASLDGGRSWRRGTQTGGGSVFDGIDPAVAFDQEGTAYLLAAGDELAVWRSTDGGLTWSGRAVVPGSAWDRPWIACGPNGQVYVAGKLPVTVFGHPARDIAALSVSRDRGEAFSFPRLFLPDPEKALLNIVSDLLVAPDGRVILTLQTFGPENLRAPLLTGSYPTIVSADGGRTFAQPRSGPVFHVYGHAREGKSLFGVGGARMAIDTSSGPRRGHLYLTWLDAIDGFYHVMAAASADGGESWSPPVRVSDNSTATDQSTPAIAVDDQGIVGISWYDRRADPTDSCYQLFFAASADGAATFSANRAIDSQPTCPLGPPSQNVAVDAVASEYRFKNGGDTQGIVGLPGGGFQLAWIRDTAGEMQLWSTIIVAQRLTAAGKPPL